ncbi:hypothetical protein BAUCODRAFT_532997 [Baudoinia panamericana UAMH 10762]|uniref:Uncharacterized protein n=1 Tax=Baudoinia panamericana (strain UAMH 10762) TaxID=717646 RepID=M2MF57_BAUPA|nr:uncharacterized protein BAUCODRAFT_532997 [Baudoinia panamericana UAMH 10762]EMC95261.1 hypothetical protein BAUCODRAFT_532997 [Baudoinia panamericana UAMH 10762]
MGWRSGRLEGVITQGMPANAASLLWIASFTGLSKVRPPKSFQTEARGFAAALGFRPLVRWLQATDRSERPAHKADIRLCLAFGPQEIYIRAPTTKESEYVGSIAIVAATIRKRSFRSSTTQPSGDFLLE